MEETLVQNGIQDESLDKYILHVENFEGPLDLLWNLIKKSKIDIIDVSISKITEQYVEYLKIMEKMNIQVASEFIQMASELLYYKSRALLPGGEIEDEYFVPPLPPELVQKLLEYKKYQLSSRKLRNMYDKQSDCYSRQINNSNMFDSSEYITMSLFDLLNAFVDILGTKKEIQEQEIIFDEILVSDRIDYIVDLLHKTEKINFHDIFPENVTKNEIVASFLAILELSKVQKVKLLQHKTFADIYIYRNFEIE